MGSRKNLRCSYCGSPSLRRSRTRTWERPLRLILLRPYRCRDCEHRCYASPWLNRAKVNDQSCSRPDTKASANSQGSGSQRTGRWIGKLGYVGLAACLVIGGMVAVAFGNKFRDWRSFDEIRSSFFSRPNQARNEGPPTKPSDAPAEMGSSIATTEQGPPSSHDDRVSRSSSAQAVRAVRPKLPANMQSKVTTDNIVRIQVSIDRSGRVISATPVSTEGPMATSLASYALESARRWRFRPARNNGRPVGSQRVLEFLFRPSDT